MNTAFLIMPTPCIISDGRRGITPKDRCTIKVQPCFPSPFSKGSTVSSLPKLPLQSSPQDFWQHSNSFSINGGDSQSDLNHFHKVFSNPHLLLLLVTSNQMSLLVIFSLYPFLSCTYVYEI